MSIRMLSRHYSTTPAVASGRAIVLEAVTPTVTSRWRSVGSMAR